MLTTGHYFSIAVLTICILNAGCVQHSFLAPVGEVGGTRLPISSNSFPLSDIPFPTNKKYKVQVGDTLYAIAWKINQDYQALARWNDIKIPYTIYVGQQLALQPTSSFQKTKSTSPNKPRLLVPSPIASSIPAPQPFLPESYGSKPNATHITKNNPRKKYPKKLNKLATWSWPAKGRVVRTFAHKNPERKGLDIAGKEGQPIKAANSGRVVYSGSGLIGYGKLIIIKHNKTYLSAYGHNRKLLVDEGDLVQAGQPIAEMGSTAEQLAMLHFEIRQKGQPIDPLQLLPKSSHARN